MIQQLRSTLEQRKGQKQNKVTTLKNIKKEYKEKTRELILHEKAREIINIVAGKTQEQLQYHISDITGMALRTVFNDPYELKVNFVERRNKTECDLTFKRGEDEISPLDASGYGAVDIASFALRIACWSMKQPRTRNLIILDEPFRFLSKDKQELASEMLKEISKKLAIQFIIVTHEDTLTQQADKMFRTVKQNKITKIK